MTETTVAQVEDEEGRDPALLAGEPTDDDLDTEVAG